MRRTRDGDGGEFDHHARLVRRLLNVPIGLVTLVEAERQVFLGAVGLPSAYQNSRETPLSHSFCQYVVKDARPLIVSDARAVDGLSDNLAIEDLDVVAYAGWPLTDHSGRVVGSLCAIDSTPREWSADEIEVLEDLATACSAELAQRQRAEEAVTALSSAEEFGEQTRALLALSVALTGTETLADVAAAVAGVAGEELGCVQAGMWLRPAEVVGAEAPGEFAARAEAQLSSEAVWRDPHVMTWVEPAGSLWRSAQAFPQLRVDADNPMGAALLRRGLIAFGDRASQNEQWPHLANPHQVGEARAFLPLLLGGRGYGTLVLMWPGRRRFTDQDRISMAALAAYTAQAVHRAQLMQSRVDAAWTLQHAMLTELPQPEHLTLAARYRPADRGEQVGGDWYDAIMTPSGATYVMIGDVAGHDMIAASVMGQLRSMMRMTSWLSSPLMSESSAPPHLDGADQDDGSGSVARELESLNRAMIDFGIGEFATAILARIEQTEDLRRRGRRLLRWSNAGHLPPVLIDRDGSARFLGGEDSSGPMLGLTPAAACHEHADEIADGSTLVFYTDGLVERRGEILDRGLERLLTAATTHAHRGAEGLLDRLLVDLLGAEAHDDVALLAVCFEVQPPLT